MISAKKTNPAYQLPSSRENESSNYLTQILLKKEKSLEDAELIYEKLKGFSSFQHFFTGNLKKMDTAQILNVCRGFKYEKCEKNNFVFKQGDNSNDKFYIILSGEVAVVNSQRLGDFGESLQGSNPDSAKSPRSMTFITASNTKSSTSSTGKDNDKRGSVIKPLKNIDLGKFENKKPLLRQGCLESQEGSVNASRQPSAESGKKKIVSKMRAVYDAVKALRTMQRCIPSLGKLGEGGMRSLTDLESRAQGSTMGTLQHLDDVEGEREEDEDDKKEFEEYASSFGKVIQYLGVGESFGEIALKKNQPRTASILCRKDCEFLTLEKQQFDEVFGKMEKEKEEFLGSVFPNLNSFSSANLNFLVCCFKPEKYNKGTYIINEGNRGEKKAKFYVIQSGECLLEKKLLKEVNNPYNTKRTLVSDYENVQISVAGKGAIIGEEILQTKDYYEYSVKTLSETVIVQAISRKDFRYRFPYDFLEFVNSQYQTKKTHREAIFENLKKDYQPKLEQYKADNIYCIKNTTMANLTTKAAKQCFSRYIKRENKVSENLNPYLMKTSGSTADGAPLQKDNSLTSFHEGLAREALRELSPEEVRNPDIEDEKRLLNSERRPRKNLFSLKIDFLSRVASPKKSPQAAQSEALEDAKFFTQIQSEKDRRTIKIRLAQMTKQYDKTAIKVSTERKTNRSSADVILNKVLGKKFDLVSHQAATGEPTTPTNAGLDSHRYVLPVDGSQLPTRRSSQKTISTQEFNSLYNQKLLKGRASTRNLSPANMAFLENNSKPQSLNELSTREYTSAPRSDFAHSRKLSSTEAWSLNDLKVFPETEKAGSIKIYEGLSHSRNNLLNAEIEKELMMLPIIPDKENRVISNEKPGTTANLLKRKNSSRVMNLPLGKGNNTGEGLKENSMYAQLNETKEWRLRIFKKPQRRSGLLSSRGFGENQDVTKEKMRLEG